MNFRLQIIVRFSLLGLWSLGIGGCSRAQRDLDTPIVTTQWKDKHLKNQLPSYHIPIPITEFDSAGLPCLLANIGHDTVPIVLDTGFCGCFRFSSSILDAIEEKVYSRSCTRYGFRGTSDCIAVYEIPKINVGRLEYSHQEVHELSEKLLIDANLRSDPDALLPRKTEEGAIGWLGFVRSNLFLDLGNLRIIAVDSLDTLQQHNYSDIRFTKTPLLTDQGIIEVAFESSVGPLRCMIDTGATCSILKMKEDKRQDLEEAVLDPTNFVDVTLRIEDNRFEGIEFVYLPIQYPIPVEAILGMTFLQEHLVFLDFYEGNAYFAKKP